MLEPHGRTLLFDLLKPPEGHTLNAAIATTFTLDLLALLTAPVAFSLFDVDDHRDLLDKDSLTLLESLRRYADKITVFCQAGQIKLPKTQFPQLEFLERCIVQCRARVEGAVFHPKIWLLRFVAGGDRVTYRFACLTRNLTFDRCWDTVVTLEGPLLDRQRAVAANHPLGDFVRALPGRATADVDEPNRQRIDLMEAEVRRVRFEPPDGFDNYGFHPLGLEATRRLPFEDRDGRMLIVSPFVSDGGLRRIVGDRKSSLLVSRPESLEQPGCSFNGIDKLFVLSRETDQEGDDSPDEGTIDLTRGLHAKCYVIDSGRTAHIFTGSANATDAGFGANVELLVELTGPKSKVGIDALFRREDAKTCLGDLLEEFKPQPKPVDEEMESTRAAIERTRYSLAGMRFTAHVLPNGDDFAVQLTAVGEATWPDAHVRVRCWPVTLGKGWAIDFQRGGATVLFERVSFEALTAFVAFEVLARDPEQSEVFVLNVSLQGAPPDRRERLLRSFIKDRQRLIRFLLFLLAEDAEIADAFGAKPPRTGASTEPGETAHSTGALLESLLRSLHRSPERLDGVARLVEDVRKQPDASDLLPPGFERIWEPIWAARRGGQP